MNAYTLSIQIVCNMTLGSLTGSQTWARRDSFILVLRSITFKTCLFNIYNVVKSGKKPQQHQIKQYSETPPARPPLLCQNCGL